MVWEKRSLGAEGKIEMLFVPEDVERVIKPTADGDGTSGWRQRGVERFFKLDKVSIESDSVIIVHCASGFKAENIVEIDPAG